MRAQSEAQKRILDQYLALGKKATLRKISLETGIQMTRVFRVLNGSPMKASEFEIFSKLVQKKMGLEFSLQQLACECMEKLSQESICEIEKLLTRKLSLWKLKQTMSNTESASQFSA